MKQILAVRSGVGLSTPQMAVIVCYASLKSAQFTLKANPNFQSWIREGQKKVVVKLKTKEELMRLWDLCQKKKISCVLVKLLNDEVALGIGPANDRRIEAITAEYKLM